MGQFSVTFLALAGSILSGNQQAMAQAGVTLPAALTLPLPPQTLVRAAPALASLDFRPTHDPRGIYARGPPSLI